MTRKHYEILARRIREQVGFTTACHDDKLISLAERERRLVALNTLACDLAFDLRADNPNFDESRFLKACGV